MQARTCIDYLKRAGYKVVHAADGEQALWLYRRETPDLILMDVIMPKMNMGMLKVETDFLKISDNISFNPIRRYLVMKGETKQLTPMETRVLKTLCLKKNQYVDKEELVREGWGNDFKESYRYLDRVIARLRKFFPKGDPVEIATSWGKGFGLMIRKNSDKG